ncbi:unnamed protein product [Lathyrus oleraceus]
MPRAKIRVRVRGAHSGAKVIDAILPGKVRTTYNKRVPVPETDTGKQATEAPVNGGRNYNGPKVAKFLVGLGGRQRRPPSGGGSSHQ